MYVNEAWDDERPGKIDASGTGRCVNGFGFDRGNAIAVDEEAAAWEYSIGQNEVSTRQQNH
jgi:hypothetical protein